MQNYIPPVLPSDTQMAPDEDKRASGFVHFQLEIAVRVMSEQPMDSLLFTCCAAELRMFVF
jgi:hypothetical protein